MSNEERTGTRDLTYSHAHRPKQLYPLLMAELGLNRVRAQQLADACTVIDIDWSEYCKWCRKTIALIEAVRGPMPKSAGVTTELAVDAGKKAYSLAYLADDDGQLTRVAIRQLHPIVTEVRVMSPGEWAVWLADLHLCHVCDDQPEWFGRAREAPFARPTSRESSEQSTGGEAA